MKGRCRRIKNQRGVALLVVLLMMALMTTIAATMTNRLFVNLNRAESQLNYQQAYWYAMSVEALARSAIKETVKGEDTVTLSQPWAVRDQIYPLDGGQAKGSVYDWQACFNVNGFRDVKPEANGTNPFLLVALQQLIESQGIESYQAEVAAASTWEYIDSDDNTQSAAGVEDGEYLARRMPHLAPNAYIGDISEWRAVNGVTQGIYQKVSPFLCATPSSKVLINVNTLEGKDSPILVALFHPNLSDDQAKQLIEARDPIDGWADVETFMADPTLSGITKENKEKVKGYFDVRSRFFLLDTEITYNSMSLRMRALLQRDKDDTVTVIRRRFGGVSERDPDNKAEQ